MEKLKGSLLEKNKVETNLRLQYPQALKLKKGAIPKRSSFPPSPPKTESKRASLPVGYVGMGQPCYRKQLDRGDAWHMLQYDIPPLCQLDTAVCGFNPNPACARDRRRSRPYTKSDDTDTPGLSGVPSNPQFGVTNIPQSSLETWKRFQKENTNVMLSKLKPSRERFASYYSLTAQANTEFSVEHVKQRVRSQSVGSYSLTAEQGSAASDSSQSDLSGKVRTDRKSPHIKQSKEERNSPYPVLERPGWDSLELVKHTRSLSLDEPSLAQLSHVSQMQNTEAPLVDPCLHYTFDETPKQVMTADRKQKKSSKYPSFFKDSRKAASSPVPGSVGKFNQLYGGRSKQSSLMRSGGKVFPRGQLARMTSKEKLRRLTRCCSKQNESFGTMFKQSMKSTPLKADSRKQAIQGFTPATPESCHNKTFDSIQTNLFAKEATEVPECQSGRSSSKHRLFLEADMKDRIMVQYDDGPSFQPPLLYLDNLRGDSVPEVSEDQVSNPGSNVVSRKVLQTFFDSARRPETTVNSSQKSDFSTMSIRELASQTESEQYGYQSSCRVYKSGPEGASSRPYSQYSDEELDFNNDSTVSAAPDQLCWLQDPGGRGADGQGPSDADLPLTGAPDIHLPKEDLSLFCKNLVKGIEELTENIHMNMDLSSNVESTSDIYASL